MVRVFIKGGVWKNSEDEILKAAVMKYGKQQWARVASLLNRKSAKQCKARWFEWLDPSVRKVEWSRQEEEKLLHLAKLMPAQWKTIGPLIGRTATQCQEHYEQLLDEAAASSQDVDVKKAADASQELRQRTQQALRPGQIDSHPETKPARPDPIDMDEDEIEMLQEARARLANTQGKKAKRKAREKMLAEAKRLADLQKRRELKQAGLLSDKARKKVSRRTKNKDIDLGVEIPFHKPAPAGFHDVSDEVERTNLIQQRRLKDVDYKKLNENEYRSRDRDAKNAQRREEARLRNLERSNMQYVVAQVSKTNDPLVTKAKRGILDLPAPQVSDVELQELSKLQTSIAKSNAEQLEAADTSANSATGALLGDYSDRPLPTPMRTPMTLSSTGGGGRTKQESILREASNLRMLETGQTPLLGGENPELLVKETSAGNGSGTADAVSTTLHVATPMMKDRSSLSQTPMSVVVPRDELGLNRPKSELRASGGGGGGDDTMSLVGGSGASISGSTFATSTVHTMSIKELAREERRAAKRARIELEQALAALPAPQFEYDLAVPEDMQDDDDDDDDMKVETVSMEQDAADIDAAKYEQQKRDAQRLYEARSSVMKHKTKLPRPLGSVTVSDSFFTNDDDDDDNTQEITSSSNAERLLLNEMITLMRHDAFAYPTTPVAGADDHQDSDGKKKKKKRKKEEQAPPPQIIPQETALDYIPEESLDLAKDMIETEMKQLIQDKVTQVMIANPQTLKDESDALAYLSKANVQSSTQGAAAAKSSTSSSSYKEEFNCLQKATAAIRKKNDKLESKLGVKNGGYVKRSEGIQHQVLNDFAQYQNSCIEQYVFQNLSWHEQQGSNLRIGHLQNQLEELESMESQEQKQYGDLLVEKKRLMLKLK
mmetsp:Transcript_5234/g.7391  ORF Transcript_5234/g.7391 Transcript_5234/m.7391 type:complete len:888 (+) Transcript_5234:157-2820(+)